MENSATSLIRQAAHAADVGNMVRIISAMWAQTCTNPHRGHYTDNFVHPLREAILATCHRKLQKLLSLELTENLDADRLLFLATSLGKMADEISWTCNRKSQPLAGLLWHRCEDIVVETILRNLSKKLASAETFTDAMGAWKSTPKYRDRVSSDTTHVWKVIHHLVQFAGTPEELQAVSEELGNVEDAAYIRSNVIAAKWIELIETFPQLLEFLNWRTRGWTWRYGDFNVFHNHMREATIDRLVEKAAALSRSHEDYFAVSQGFSGSCIARSTSGDWKILLYWFEHAREQITSSIDRKAHTYSASGRKELIHSWWRLGFPLSSDLAPTT